MERCEFAAIYRRYSPEERAWENFDERLLPSR
jgi:hypothetical protein